MDSDTQALDRFDRMKRDAWWLGLAGLVPFATTALLMLVLGGKSAMAEPLLNLFRIYSALILSFLGGVRWGHALYRNLKDAESFSPGRHVLWGAIAASLAGLVAMLLEPVPGLLLLLVSFCAMGAWDSLAANNGGLPKWFGPLRVTLTLAVAACHVVALIAQIM